MGMLLLEHNANTGDTDDKGRTPLHNAIVGYHSSRAAKTCAFVKALLDHSADPKKKDKSGETPAHLAIKTMDFQVMSYFIDYLGRECLDLKDSSGNTFFHYAVSYLGEQAIYALIERGANLMSKNTAEVNMEENLLNNDSFGDVKTVMRSNSILIQRLPLQEAMKNDNIKSYFNAICRLDFSEVLSQWDEKTKTEFLCSHIVAATREVRADIVRLLFLQIQDATWLHKILLYKDKNNEDQTFTKTALEWAVENNDRLCTTEILHQEFECHRSSKDDGLKCLRRQLTGDELLTWTIETFTMFYPKSFAQKNIMPLFDLVPLFVSFSTFVYDYYSDIELSLEYYRKSMDVKEGTIPITNVTSGTGTSTSSICTDIERTPNEYRIALIVNVTCIILPLVIFFFMCARELLPAIQKLDKWCNKNCSPALYYVAVPLPLYALWLVVSVLCAPFFILYVAARHVYFKFRHRRAIRKNLFRSQLQKSEYLWGISRTAEAGLESCGQLILQVWLLSSNFKTLADDNFWGVLDKMYTGVIFFLTFSYKPASNIEKSLGKIFMSSMALIFGVTACYRTLKRGSVGFWNTGLIWMSLFFQVLARGFSIALYFFAVRDFMLNVIIFLCIHFVIVFVVKWSMERARHTKGILAYLVSFVNILASSFVYVRILPIAKRESKRSNNYYSGRNAQHHSTFLVQLIFFSLVFVENLLLVSVPFLYDSGDGTNRALECLGEEKLRLYCFYAFLMCFGSWISHILYYKCWGHPWADINGPDLTCYHLRFNFHFWGKERVFTWNWNVKRREEDVEEPLSAFNCCCKKFACTCQTDDDDSVYGNLVKPATPIELQNLGQVH